MKNYIFVLGRDYKLSLLELISYFSSRKIGFDLKEFSKEVAIFSLGDLNLNKIIDDLGGTVKIARVISKAFDFEIDGFIYSDKINYSISSYGKTKLGTDLRVYLKNKFKQGKVKAMLKKGKTKQPVPKDLKNLVDFVVYKDFVAFTVAVFDPKGYKERDKRPCNDFLKSTSIRLSKILINLSGVKPGELLLDPFCGTGVILQEALLERINVIGLDIDKKSVDFSRKNCEWLKKKYKLKSKFKVIFGDSTMLNNFLKEKVDVVVTEPYLGPFLKKPLSFDESKGVALEIEEIYFKFLKSLKKIVKNKIVLIVPVFTTRNKREIRININSMLGESGFKISDFGIFDLPILYSVDRGKIKREIYVLDKKL